MYKCTNTLIAKRQTVSEKLVKSQSISNFDIYTYFSVSIPLLFLNISLPVVHFKFHRNEMLPLAKPTKLYSINCPLNLHFICISNDHKIINLDLSTLYIFKISFFFLSYVNEYSLANSHLTYLVQALTSYTFLHLPFHFYISHYLFFSS